MGHFAKIDGSNLVTQVTIIDDDEIRGNGGEYTTEVETYVGELLGGNWKQCSHTGRKRVNFPGIGWTYDPIKDAFIPPDSLKPYPSWVWDDDICWWKPPVDMPAATTGDEAAGQKDENEVYTVRPYFWQWNESTTNWVKINTEA